VGVVDNPKITLISDGIKPKMASVLCCKLLHRSGLSEPDIQGCASFTIVSRLTFLFPRSRLPT
jgi:hypothetical protein